MSTMKIPYDALRQATNKFSSYDSEKEPLAFLDHEDGTTYVFTPVYEKHIQEKHVDKNFGAIGGAITYSFTPTGKIFTYIHANGQIGAMVKIMTQTDFATRTDVFNEFGKNVAMQIAAMNPENLDRLLDQNFIKDPSLTIIELASGPDFKAQRAGVYRRVHPV